MEASLSRLLPSTPKTKLTLKRPLETDGGDSSSDEDDLYADNDTSLGREAKALYQSVARQCATDFQKEKREAFKRIQSDVSKFSLGKKNVRVRVPERAAQRQTLRKTTRQQMRKVLLFRTQATGRQTG